MKGLPFDLSFPRRAWLLPTALFDARSEFCGLMGERPVAREVARAKAVRAPLRAHAPMERVEAPSRALP